MQRSFASILAFAVAAATAFLLKPCAAFADSQLLDPGWHLAYPGGQPRSGGGFISYVFGEGSVPRDYQPPIYYQQAPAQRMYRSAPQYYAIVPAEQLRAYQRSAPQYYVAVPVQQQPRNYQQTVPQYYAVAPPQEGAAYQPAQQPRNYQQTVPQYYAVAPPQQGSAYQPAQIYYQPLSAPQPGAGQPAPQFYQPPAAQQPVARNDPTGGYAPSGAGDMAHPALNPKYERQVVDYQGEEKPGTIIIDTPHFFLYLVLEGGKALRYGIGVGRPGFTWAGVKQVSAMREWPDWYPPSDMLARRPDLPRFMPGGPDNPLGARALYLGSTLYRVHGSNEPWTIGTQVSSGCIRLRNEDVIDLYQRVKVGTRVVVI